MFPKIPNPGWYNIEIGSFWSTKSEVKIPKNPKFRRLRFGITEVKNPVRKFKNLWDFNGEIFWNFLDFYLKDLIFYHQIENFLPDQMKILALGWNGSDQNHKEHSFFLLLYFSDPSNQKFILLCWIDVSVMPWAILCLRLFHVRIRWL